jgi:hypothetical protein
MYVWIFAGKSEGRIHSFIYLFIHQWLYSPLLGPGLFFSCVIFFYTDGRPVARPLPTHRTTQKQNKRTQASMPWVGFAPTIPAYERAKTVEGKMQFDNPRLRQEDIVKMDLREVGWKGLNCIQRAQTGTILRFLWTQFYPSELRNRLRIS